MEPFLFAVPIAVKGALYGVMLVEEAAGGLRFRNRRLEIITGIAQQVALAIQNDMRLINWVYGRLSPSSSVW